MSAPRVVQADRAGVDEAARRLRAGELVAFPTETVYGLGALALSPPAVARIFAAKGRPATNPLIVHVLDLAAASALVTAVPEAARRLAAAFWPGPLSLVLPRRPGVPDIVTAGGSTVALRSPAHPVARLLLAAVGAPVAAPSANRSGEVSPTTAAHVAASLGDRVALVLDGGACAVGIESTVVDLSGDEPVLLRPGSIGRPALESVLGQPVLTRESAPRGPGPLRSPGLLDRHYAPRARVALVDAADVEPTRASLAASGLRAATLTLRPVRAPGPREGSPRPYPYRELPDDPDGYAHALYEALHMLDDVSDAIVIERPPPAEAWAAIHDRLRRAATP